MTFGSVYIIGFLGVYILCALHVLQYSVRRACRAYTNYVNDGIMDGFDILASNALTENHPLAILVDGALLLAFSIIFSGIWPVSLLSALVFIIAWCHRHVRLRLTENVRIMEKLKGKHSS